MISFLRSLPPAWFFAGALIFSILALAGALTGQFAFDMAPCMLCIYQRIPYAVIIGLSLIGLFLQRMPALFLGLISLSFLSNAAIAFYHSGVERHWWEESNGCAVSFDFDNFDGQSLLDKISSAQVGSCADIPWADPLIGLTMANYNAIFCLGLGVFFTFVTMGCLKASAQ